MPARKNAGRSYPKKTSSPVPAAALFGESIPPSPPPFVLDDYDDDNERLGDEEPLAVTAERLRKAASPADTSTEQADEPTVVFEADQAEAPPPPPKS